MGYYILFDDDSGKWLVLNQFDEFAAGPFREVEAAEAWIALQHQAARKRRMNNE